MMRWLLILTKPSGERTAQCHLERQGFRVYYPRLLTTSLYRGRWIDRVVSLFPRYVFLQANLNQQSVAPVRSTTGVADVVRFGGEFATVPDAVVDSLIARADPESGLHRLNCSRALERGAPVSIVAGAFEGLEGIFERPAGEDRVIVLLKLLGRDTPVGVPAHFVLPSVA
jgi:transcriptional antiterminator RfaH